MMLVMPWLRNWRTAALRNMVDLNQGILVINLFAVTPVNAAIRYYALAFTDQYIKDYWEDMGWNNYYIRHR